MHVACDSIAESIIVDNVGKANLYKMTSQVSKSLCLVLSHSVAPPRMENKAEQDRNFCLTTTYLDYIC